MAIGERKFLLVAVEFLEVGGSRPACQNHRANDHQNCLAEHHLLFDIPRRLVSDNERQFAGQRLREWCESYDIQQASVAYPQGNGQAEIANQEILRVLRARLVGGSWVDELPNVLWALCTIPKEATGMIPFHLVYDSEAVVPMEVGVESDRVQHYDKGNVERRLMELDLVDEMRAKVAVRLTAYRQRMKQNYNRRVWLSASALGGIIAAQARASSHILASGPWMMIWCSETRDSALDSRHSSVGRCKITVIWRWLLEAGCAEVTLPDGRDEEAGRMPDFLIFNCGGRKATDGAQTAP
ncbi:uncharacterized protein LOC122043872 [Zingiber officinale]|uniref:uncharacterized protein LOC122043872 n=1 Tax=Zingiber officinale TaxID=94328 RepID=UPI001C4D5436|nr:uncharacterized protein LOC122043872 [Zingiber officinale]